MANGGNGVKKTEITYPIFPIARVVAVRVALKILHTVCTSRKRLIDR